MEVITKEIEKPLELREQVEGKPAVKTEKKPPRSVPTPPTVRKHRVTRDRPIKSIFKAITWRLIASATTFGLAYLFFHKEPYAVQKATGIAGAEALIKMLLYFFHERLWERVRWGLMMVIIRRGTRKSKKSIRRIILREPL
ncbi:MAG: DUF2061 domain-containing protein [Bacteroidota bacterium]|nr:DUF2061 domain-containing protein [Bacteroidota bacterium]